MDRLQPPAEGDGWKWKNKVWLSRLPWPEWLRSYTDNILTHCCLMFHDVFINLDQERKGTGPVCELKSHKTWKGRFLRTSSNVFHVQQKILLYVHVHEYVLLIFYPGFLMKTFLTLQEIELHCLFFVCFLYYSLWDYFALQFCWHVEQSLI